MDRIQKFLSKLSPKQRSLSLKIFEDILSLELKNYDIKPLKGMKNIFRLRKGDVRVVFTKTDSKGYVLDINFRKDVYKA